MDFSSDAPGYRGILERAARPRGGLYDKALGEYIDPVVPEPAEWTFHTLDQPMMIRKPASNELLPSSMTDIRQFQRGVAPPLGSTTATELTFRTDASPWGGDLGAFLRHSLAPAFHFVRVRVIGSGHHRFTPVKLPRGLRLEIKVEAGPQGGMPEWSPAEGTTGTALIELEGGVLGLWNVTLRHEKAPGLLHLIHVQDGHLVLSNCRLTAKTPAETAGDLISFRAATTQPLSGNLPEPVFSFQIDRPVCRLSGCVLITGGRALQAELGRGLVALSQCAIAAGGPAIELKPAAVARTRFEADLVLEHCTLTSLRTIVQADSWPGNAPGPNRPWLITSRHCAFMSATGRSTVLLRGEGDALANGSVFWQADDDANEVDWFISASDAPPAANRPRDVQQQWVQFWGRNHMGRVTGPRGSGSKPTVRFLERRRRTDQEIEPADLMLDPSYHPDRPELSVGADLSGWTNTIRPAAPPGKQGSSVPF